MTRLLKLPDGVAPARGVVPADRAADAVVRALVDAGVDTYCSRWPRRS